jgi:CubicO group peptidase (beta-lactamase class C family)
VGALTVRELLSHASGIIRDGFDGDHWQGGRPFPDRDTLLSMLRQDDTVVLPANDRWKYSNLGYAVLGQIVEASAGAGFDDCVRTRIVDRLGLRNTGADFTGDRSDDYVVGYSSFEYTARRVPFDHDEISTMAPAAGVYSTAEDLVSFFSAHFPGDDRLVSDAAKRQMQHPLWRSKQNDRTLHYGLGMQLDEVAGRQLIGHGGGFMGQITRSVADPQARIAVSVLTNAIDVAPEPLAFAAIRLIDLAGAQPRPSEDTRLTRFTGRFANIFGVRDVAVLGGRLFALEPASLDPVADAIPLEVVDESTLRFAGGNDGTYGEPMTFSFAADGSVETVRGALRMTLTPLDDFVVPERFTFTATEPAAVL